MLVGPLAFPVRRLVIVLMAITCNHLQSCHEVKTMDLLILLHLMPRSCLGLTSFFITIAFTPTRSTAIVPVVLGPRQVTNVVLI